MGWRSINVREGTARASLDSPGWLYLCNFRDVADTVDVFVSNVDYEIATNGTATYSVALGAHGVARVIVNGCVVIQQSSTGQIGYYFDPRIS